MRQKLKIVPIALGFVLAIAVVYAQAVPRNKTNLNELALNASTVAIFSTRNESPIHIERLSDLKELVGGIESANMASLVLWLGNSQLHAINQWKPGEENASAILHDLLIRKQTYLAAISFPNASFQEHLVAFAASLEESIPDVLILPAVFDDTREDGLRPEIKEFLSQSLFAQGLLAKSVIGKKLIDESNFSERPVAELGGNLKSMQNASEEYIEATLSDHSLLWRSRLQIRGEISVS